MAKQSRRKFLFAGVSLAAIWASFSFIRKQKEKQTVKFLTQEGKLVELDIDKLPSSKKSASITDIQNWIKNKLG